MGKEARDYLLVVVPAITLAPVLWALALPSWLVILSASLAVALPALACLRRLHLVLRQQHLDNLAFTRQVIDVIPQPVYVKDADSRYIIVNRAFCEERGLPLSSIVGFTTSDISRNETDSDISRREDLAILQGEVIRKEQHDMHPSRGTERHRLIMKGACHMPTGKTVIVGANFDLSHWWSNAQDLAHELRQQRTQHEDTLESLSAEVALRERTQAFIQRLIDVIPDPVFIKKSGGVYVMINEAFARYRNVDKLGFKGFKRHEPSADPALRAASMQEDEDVLAGLESDKEDYTVRQSTGEEIFRVISKRRSVFVDGDPVIVGIEHHITRWKLAERELKAVLEREKAQRLRTERFVQDLIDVIPDPVYVKSADGRYLIVNAAFARVRRRPREELIGIVSPSEVSRAEDQRVIAGEEVLKEEHRIRSTGEEVFRVVYKHRCIHVDGSPVVVGIDHYITEWRLAERELKRLAEEDVLTGIANRRHFNAEACRALELAHRHHEQLSLLIFDLDHFKHINDRYGHNIGDEVLREMSKRMQASFRKSDLPGRWGGEEFIALLPHTSVMVAQQVAERLRAWMADEPAATSCGNIPVTLSCGGAQLCEGDTLESLVARADAALYRAKDGGRNRVEINTDTTPAGEETADLSASVTVVRDR